MDDTSRCKVTQTSFSFYHVGTVDAAMRAPIASSKGPETSRLAAADITESGKREGQLLGVLALVKRYPLSTSQELARKGALYDRYIIARRLPELLRGHLVQKRSARKCGVTGKMATQWEAL